MIPTITSHSTLEIGLSSLNNELLFLNKLEDHHCKAPLAFGKSEEKIYAKHQFADGYKLNQTLIKAHRSNQAFKFELKKYQRETVVGLQYLEAVDCSQGKLGSMVDGTLGIIPY